MAVRAIILFLARRRRILYSDFLAFCRRMIARGWLHAATFAILLVFILLEVAHDRRLFDYRGVLFGGE